MKYWTFFICCFLSGCASYTYVTGVSKSYQPYCIKGDYFYPQNYYEYSEHGLASWYGPGFHGCKTASGQVYDQHTMTAAHRTLPIPSIVRVTNLCTRKSIVVLVHDRGPFRSDYCFSRNPRYRIIDLSYAAARKLGVHRRGLAHVHVECLPQESAVFSNYLAHCTRCHGSKRVNWVHLFNKYYCCEN